MLKFITSLSYAFNSSRVIRGSCNAWPGDFNNCILLLWQNPGYLLHIDIKCLVFVLIIDDFRVHLFE